jgi:CRISPR-associated protein Cas1
MGTLYVFEPDVYVSKDGGELKVSRRKGREVLTRKPLVHVSELVVFGNATVTSSALYALMEQDSPVHYLTRGGTYFAQTIPSENKNVPLRLEQLRAHLDDDQKHCLARRFVLGKIHNASVFAKRGGADVYPLTDVARDIETCADTEALRGLEGNAARAYFELIRDRFPADFAFMNRNKRPPRDPVNSLLSLAYTFLEKEIRTAIRIAGLDPYVGFLHEVKYGKPALSLDLMEEFRAILADSVVLALFNKNMITTEHFDDSEGFPKLTEDGFKQFLRAWEDRLSQKVTHPLLKQKRHYRQILVDQARILGKHLMGELPDYVPFVVR